MLRRSLAISWLLAATQVAVSAEVLDPRQVFDAVTIGNLLFVYENGDFLGQERKGAALTDVIKPADALTKAEPGLDVEELVDWTLEFHHEFSLDRMVLRDYGSDSFFWLVTWSLYPSPGGSTGIPWQYGVWLTGDGRRVAPRVYLWDAGYYNDEQWIQSYFPMNDLRVKPGAKILHGDEITKRATQRLAEFMSEQSAAKQRASSSDPEERQPVWQFHSQTLISDLPGSVKAWRVSFINSNLVDDEYDPNDLRDFSIWVSEDGRLGALSMGAERFKEPRW